MFEWDEKKRKANLSKHHIDFNAVWDMDFVSAIRQPDLRANYGEARFVVFGFIGKRLHCLAHAWRGETIRVISLRKANAREQRMYEEKTETFDE